MKNQPLKDKSCLVPCTGVYADVEDDFNQELLQYKEATDALEKNMIKGDICFDFYDISWL